MKYQEQKIQEIASRSKTEKIKRNANTKFESASVRFAESGGLGWDEFENEVESVNQNLLSIISPTTGKNLGIQTKSAESIMVSYFKKLSTMQKINLLKSKEGFDGLSKSLKAEGEGPLDHSFALNLIIRHSEALVAERSRLAQDSNFHESSQNNENESRTLSENITIYLKNHSDALNASQTTSLGNYQKQLLEDYSNIVPGSVDDVDALLETQAGMSQ